MAGPQWPGHVIKRLQTLAAGPQTFDLQRSKQSNYDLSVCNEKQATVCQAVDAKEKTVACPQTWTFHL